MADVIIDHYERHAIAWDRDRSNGSWNDAKWHRRFVNQLRSGATVLDIGCGSGRPVAEFLAKSGLLVTGVDSSPTLLSLSRRRLPEHEWINCDMRRLSLDRRFDSLLAWDSFFHLSHDDQRRMFAVFDHHASSEAVLMFNTGPGHREAIGSYQGEPIYHASLAPSEYERLLQDHGFDVLDHVANDQEAGGRTVWLCGRRKR